MGAVSGSPGPRPAESRHRTIAPVTTTDWSPGPADAAVHFARRLAVETDVSDVHAAMESGAPGFVLLDSRSREAWDQGHVPGALHVPLAELEARLHELPSVGQDPDLVVYCWGPGCNGSTRGALVLAEAGYRRVREMIGGYEYWAREGLSIETATGRTRRPTDDLTAPVPSQGRALLVEGV